MSPFENPVVDARVRRVTHRFRRCFGPVRLEALPSTSSRPVRFGALPTFAALLLALVSCKSTTGPTNNRPTFTMGPSQVVWHDAGPQTVTTWATAISAGSTGGSGQALVFTLTNTDSTLFSVQPAISPDGTLTFSPDTVADGTDTVGVTLRYNGGTGSVKADSSATRTFTIAVGPVAYVTNNSDGTVSVINVASGTVTGTIWIGSTPEDVAFTPDGKTAYVTSQSGNDVAVIDVASGTVTKRIPIFSRATFGAHPEGVAFTPDGKTAYVTHSFDSTVSVIDVASGTVTGTIPVGYETVGVAFTPDGNTAYVADPASEVAAIDVASGTVTDTINVGGTPWGVAITPDGKTAYVTDYSGSGVSVIDVASGTLRSTIPVKPPGLVSLLGSNLEGVAFTPDGRTAYVADNVPNWTAGYVGVVDVASGTMTSTITVGAGPEWVAFTPDGKTAYVTENGSNEVSVIDVASGTVTTTIPVGASPVGVAIH